jgi:hypothetical protein
MTTRNFRVHNGISVGDVTISASTNKITGLSVSAPSADGDVATKKYVDDSLGALSSNSITQGNTSISISDSGANGTITMTADGNAELEVNDSGVVIYGNLTVQGTETIVSTQNLLIEDAIIGLNSNVSDKNNMPRFSGIHLHRGTGSDPLDQDLFFVWDDAYADDGTTIYGNAGGAFTALRSTTNEDTETPNDDFQLVDMRCNILHATATSAQYADIAERFAADAPMAEGAVVMLGGSEEITETTEDKSAKVFGVISTKPAYLMNAAAGNNESHPFVAMTGRTPVRVSGPVNKGDRLVSSSIKGTARAVADSEEINPFHVIGRALESKYDAGIGMVNCVVRTNN